MTKRKTRLDKSRTPQKFSIHLSKSNLEKVKEIEEILNLNSRNETINHIIDRFWNYLHYKDLIDALNRHYRTEYKTVKTKYGAVTFPVTSKR